MSRHVSLCPHCGESVPFEAKKEDVQVITSTDCPCCEKTFVANLGTQDSFSNDKYTELLRQYEFAKLVVDAADSFLEQMRKRGFSEAISELNLLKTRVSLYKEKSSALKN